MQPTQDAYTEMAQAYDHFNAELFGGELPRCLITFQREKRTYGYFSSKRFINNGDKSITDEIAMNPAYFPITPLLETFQTLVHEMTHLWQEHFGDPGRGRYHNKEWAQKMISVGLMPSHTGKPGGKTTGDQMMDYTIKGGVFEQAVEKLLATGFAITWYDRYPARGAAEHVMTAAMTGTIADVHLADILGIPEGVPLTPELVELQPAKPTRSKYTCKTIDKHEGRRIHRLWGKPGMKIICGECMEPYVEV